MTPTRIQAIWESTGSGRYSVEIRVDGQEKSRTVQLTKADFDRIVAELKAEFPENIIEVEPAILS